MSTMLRRTIRPTARRDHLVADTSIATVRHARRDRDRRRHAPRPTDALRPTDAPRHPGDGGIQAPTASATETVSRIRPDCRTGSLRSRDASRRNVRRRILHPDRRCPRTRDSQRPAGRDRAHGEALRGRGVRTRRDPVHRGIRPDQRRRHLCGDGIVRGSLTGTAGTFSFAHSATTSPHRQVCGVLRHRSQQRHRGSRRNHWYRRDDSRRRWNTHRIWFDCQID